MVDRSAFERFGANDVLKTGKWLVPAIDKNSF